MEDCKFKDDNGFCCDVRSKYADDLCSSDCDWFIPQQANDGGSADYYKLPKGATDLQDIIEHKEMCYSVGNIFKAAYRLNDTTHSDPKRDLRKIIWFAERELERLKEVP